MYYAVMTSLKDERPKEHLKMGEELKETVEEILDRIEIYRENYVDA